MCLRINSPATDRVGNGGCPGPERQTELKHPAKKSQSISLARPTSLGALALLPADPGLPM